MDARQDALTRVAGPVSRETYEGLETFEELFRTWNRRINLASSSTLDRFWDRHVLDSAQIVRLADGATRWLDLGSGGGLPGAVIAILMRGVEEAHVDLVESNRRKAAFLINALGAARAPATVHAVRIEDAVSMVEAPQIVTARALAPLPLLLELSAPWLTAGARGLFHKGRGYRNEVEESLKEWRFDLVEHQSTIDGGGVIVDIANLTHRRFDKKLTLGSKD